MYSVNAIKEQFNSWVSITEKDWIYFKDRLHHVSYNKKDVVTSFGQIENSLYFLARGIVRHVVNDIKESTSDFTFPGQFFCSYSSFLKRNPSLYQIMPVTGTVECFYLSYEKLQEVYQNTECGERIGRLAAEQQFQRKSVREISLLTLNPKEKYEQLLNEQPHLIQHIPLKYLASYLGITPETLSRIRASIS